MNQDYFTTKSLYKLKYLKYKEKYLVTKAKLLGGGSVDDFINKLAEVTEWQAAQTKSSDIDFEILFMILFGRFSAKKCEEYNLSPVRNFIRTTRKNPIYLEIKEKIELLLLTKLDDQVTNTKLLSLLTLLSRNSPVNIDDDQVAEYPTLEANGNVKGKYSTQHASKAVGKVFKHILSILKSRRATININVFFKVDGQFCRISEDRQLVKAKGGNIVTEIDGKITKIKKDLKNIPTTIEKNEKIIKFKQSADPTTDTSQWSGTIDRLQKELVQLTANLSYYESLKSMCEEILARDPIGSTYEIFMMGENRFDTYTKILARDHPIISHLSPKIQIDYKATGISESDLIADLGHLPLDQKILVKANELAANYIDAYSDAHSDASAEIKESIRSNTYPIEGVILTFDIGLSDGTVINCLLKLKNPQNLDEGDKVQVLE
jgi:hypothetical protein